MPDTKITALTAISTVNPATYPLPIVDTVDTTMAGSGTTKKITINQILGAGGTATLASATITGDLTVRTNVISATSSGVGFGINTAAAAIDVVSSFQWRSNTGGTDKLAIFSGGAGLIYLGSTTASALSFLYNGSEAMRLNSTGLGVGVSPSFKGHFYSASGSNGVRLQTGSTTAGDTNRLSFQNASGAADARTGCIEWYDVGSFKGDVRFLKAGGIQIRNSADSPTFNLDDSGNVGIGVTPINRLTVAGNMAVGGTGNNGLQFHSGSPVSGNLVWWLTNDQANSNILNLYYYNAGVFSGRAFVVNQSGNFMVRTPSTPPTIPDNEMMVFNLTSNTNLRISVKGTDGTVRTANITLA